MKSFNIWNTTARQNPVIKEGTRKLDEVTADHVADYLRSGAVILRTTYSIPDRFAPEKGDIVGISTRTDGEWYWDDSDMYYIRRYHFSPGEEFVEHCRTHHYVARTPTDSEVMELQNLLSMDKLPRV